MSDASKQSECNAVLANERTYAAWIRTGLAAFVTGLGAEKFLGGVIPDPFIRITSMAMFSCSILFFILALWRFRHVAGHLVSERVLGAPLPVLVVVTMMLVIVVSLALLGVWIR